MVKSTNSNAISKLLFAKKIFESIDKFNSNNTVLKNEFKIKKIIIIKLQEAI